MQWLHDTHGNKKSASKRWETSRACINRLAQHHDYLPSDFHWQLAVPTQSSVLSKKAFQASNAVRNGTSGKAIDHENDYLSKPRLTEFLNELMQLPAGSSTAAMLLYIGCAIQTLARSHQLCNLRRWHLTVYPEEEMHETADFGQVEMFGLGDQGNLKTDPTANTQHFIAPCLSPQLLDPVFALAMKAAHDGTAATVYKPALSGNTAL